MGSFNMTCAVSKLAIREGDEVLLFFISSEGVGEWVNCYPSGAWSLASFPIPAKYADYGRYTWDAQDPNFQRFFNQVCKLLIPVPAGDNPYHDREVSVEKIMGPDDQGVNDVSYEYFQDVVAHARVKCRVHYGQPRIIGTFAILKTVYDKMMAAKLPSWRYKEGFTWNITKEKMLEEFKRVDEVVATLPVERQPGAKELHRRGDADWSDSIGMDIRYFNRWHELSQLEDDTLTELIAKINFLGEWFYRTRTMIHPVMSSGQDWGDEFMQDFHRMCADIAKARIQEYEEEYGEHTDNFEVEEEEGTPI